MPIFKHQKINTIERKYLREVVSIPTPDLIEVQKNSYDWFLKFGVKELFEEIINL